LSDDAATLFGMTGAERAAVDNSVQTFREAIQRLQSTYAQLDPAAAGENSSTHREITYQVPAMTNEFSQLETQCEASVTAAIGLKRSALFLERARELLKASYGQFGNDGYSVTLYADRNAAGEVSHQIRFSQENGSGKNFYNYSVYFPLSPESILWDYRHLFGQEPLLEQADDLGAGR
jgi:hypothetical protein